MKLYKFVLVLAPFLCFATHAAHSNKTTYDQDFLTISNTFEISYAPYKWKEEHYGWQINHEIEKVKLALLSINNLKSAQKELKKFFNSCRDYHVSIFFASTEASLLPFEVKEAEGRYFISAIHKGESSPVKVGDEIILFDGRPIQSVVDEIMLTDTPSASPMTDRVIALNLLTMRLGLRGQEVPKGPCQIVCKNKKGKEVTWKLDWIYYPEKIQDLYKNHLLASTPAPQKKSFEALKKEMVAPSLKVVKDYSLSDTDQPGSRVSFMPRLGKKIWESHSDSFFHAYLFETPEHKTIGYLRIPNYVADDHEIEELKPIISLFQQSTEALVIDQVNNPGGYVFAVYGISSFLTNKPLHVPKHRLTLTQREIMEAVTMLETLEEIKSDQDAREVFGNSFFGLPVNLNFVNNLKSFYEFEISQWNEGKTFTDPVSIYGINEIKPNPMVHYTKPIVFLINEMDISGGDFMPAILQDNKRALIIGTKTAGAGGVVSGNSFINRSGILAYSLTSSIAERSNSKPIENLGVSPDHELKLTVDDIQSGYHNYTQAILHHVNELSSKKK